MSRPEEAGIAVPNGEYGQPVKPHNFIEIATFQNRFGPSG
jgi:hypothetical protein